MKVSNRMIHKDVRLAGAVLRLFTSHVTVEGYRKARASSEKKIDQALPRRAKMEKVYLKRPDGSQMRMVILKPAHAAKKVPAVLFLHGGGYVLGTPEEKIGFMEDMMEAADCVMMAPDYTLALDEPYPAALKDAYQALLWMKEHGGEYGARDDQLFVMGESAGGGLAAALCIYARDRGEVSIAFQMPMFPMLDDRCNTESALDNDAPMWNIRSNKLAWSLYLGELYGTDEVPVYAAPSRLEDFSELPPAYSYVGTIEPFYDEARIYFEKLKEAGVKCRLDTYQGGFHGFDEIGKKKPLGREARRKRNEAFRYAAEHFFKGQEDSVSL